MSQDAVQDMEEQRASIITTCTYLVETEVRFRDIDLLKASAEHDKRLRNMVLPKNVAHLSDGKCHQQRGV